MLSKAQNAVASFPIFGWIAKNLHIIVLIGIMLAAFWIRIPPVKFNEINGLDEFYFYRISEYVLTHGLQLPERDLMRNYPFGSNPSQDDLLGTLFIPPLMYIPIAAFLSLFGAKLFYYTFVMYYAPIMAVLAALAMYIFGREFYDRKAGLFAALLVSTVPAFLTRTMGTSIEKEPTIAPFMIFAMALFYGAYKRMSWKYGLLAGLSLFLVDLTSSIVQFYILVISIFCILAFLQYKNTSRLFYSTFFLFIGLCVGLLFYKSVLKGPLGLIFMGVAAMVAISYLLQRRGMIKESQQHYLPFAILGVGFVLVFALIVATGRLESTINNFDTLISQKNRDPIGFTVAENQPGNVASAIDSSDAKYAASRLGILAPLAPLFSVWLFAFVGFGLMIYQLVRTRDFAYLLPIVWMFGSLWATNFQIRFLFLYGPAAAFLAGYALSWIANQAQRFAPESNEWRRYAVSGALLIASFTLLYVLLPSIPAGGSINLQPIASITANIAALGALFLLLRKDFSLESLGYLLGSYIGIGIIAWMLFGQESLLIYPFLFSLVMAGFFAYLKKMPYRQLLPPTAFFLISLLLAANLVNGFIYASGIGPTICFPHLLQANEPCVKLDANGNQILAQGQPWYAAMDFLAQQPANSNVLSWWDFGYWFQTRGKQPSVSDGGYGPRHEIADWFTDRPENWSAYLPWLRDKYKVSYIFMDYTLPSKYGAISAIHLRGDPNIQQVLQVQQSRQFQRGNTTVVEFCCISTSQAQFVIWLPIDQQGGIAGQPQVLGRLGEQQYVPSGYLNEVCTPNGIVQAGNQSQDIGGCLSVSSFGVFYVPETVENTIFTSLMFMDGAGLPVKKEFDNQLIKIYKVIYDSNATAG
ncbi:MAG: glycosyltransferase family 39 protein [Candidatus Aenigmarchaeota archaeon]|nr:glycosyltransferase family 39 protein [Candidatus Aenigmarchaeota archaeon]